MKKFGLFVLLLQLCQALQNAPVSYKNFRVYEVSEEGLDTPPLKLPGSDKGLQVLNQYHTFDNNGKACVVRSYLIPASEEKTFLKILSLVKADYNISVHDLEKSIEEEKQSLKTFARRSQSGHALQKELYLPYDEIVQYLWYVASIKNPENNEPLALVERIGESYEGRDMYIVKISSDHSAKKPIIFFEAGIHAREWTAPAAVLYTIYQLVENYTSTMSILNNIDFYIIPVSNPDGYEYSRTKDRLWRKTRSVNNGFYGVDGNRNFGFHWGEKGTSSDPESEIYKGPYPFSEVETRNIRDVGKRYMDRIKAFVSVHAYGPVIVYPWSYARTFRAPHTKAMHKVAQAAADAIKKRNGTNYLVGNSGVLMYEAAGGSDDYFKAVLGVDLSFTFELSSAGEKSFIVPSNKTLAIISEAFEGFKVIAKEASRYKKSIKQKKKLKN